jgi:hypothetical protein
MDKAKEVLLAAIKQNMNHYRRNGSLFSYHAKGQLEYAAAMEWQDVLDLARDYAGSIFGFGTEGFWQFFDK